MPDVLQSEAQQCKHCVLPRMPGGLALPLSSSQRVRVREREKGDSGSSYKDIRVWARGPVFPQS